MSTVLVDDAGEEVPGASTRSASEYLTGKYRNKLFLIIGECAPIISSANSSTVKTTKFFTCLDKLEEWRSSLPARLDQNKFDVDILTLQ